ncbi:helix-turn-helix transcriptional regulator [Massilia suwonensis]|uniref:Helix-turn-helix transcriptional regulator n=1 Tax=Massilia suwonensis TaxID=648895 RepID=A0ABW0MHJ7_9BURK
MNTPRFADIVGTTLTQHRSLLSDRVRLERKQRGFSQTAFAAMLGVPLRTYKRFELGDSDSLEIFLRILIFTQRTIALDLVFPDPAAVVKQRTPLAALDRLKQTKAAKDRATALDLEHTSKTN